jgi:hypothetical protein
MRPEAGGVMTAQPNVAEPSREASRVPGRAADHEAAVAAASPAASADPTYQGESPAFDPASFAGDLLAYLRDATERSILFWDALRQRADNMLAHERAGKPALLDFDYEVLIDARRFEQPANYALLRVTRVGDDCLDDCLDPAKSPVMVLDPRAGHGPGIGGFKRDSEIGMALHQGHPVYFVTFFPEPMENQTLADVLHALRRFVQEVAERHPGAAPVVYGNCQAGWAATLLAADCAGLAGPVILNGTPLSYWAGESGVNPMRMAAGFGGGAWLAHFLADLGDGRFDGAWLVQNFEGLKPEAVWQKYAGLYADMDRERERFLAFERWWNGFYFLSREEILAIVENLFIGNRLEEGSLRICEGCVADLRRIRNPLVIFASHGDNITPPHQALAWIPVVYADTTDLKAAGQRIVYLINQHVGHLGIFVSAKVARLEHRAILESLSRIESLPPGLYEMKIDDRTGDPDCAADAFQVRFVDRQVSDIDFPREVEALEQVRSMSERSEAFYSSFVSPWVRLVTTPWSAAMAEALHPMRTSRYFFSESALPWMRGVRVLAEMIIGDRHAVAPDNSFRAQEARFIGDVTDILEVSRRMRDAVWERAFDEIYARTPQSPHSSPARHGQAISA